MRPVTVTVGPLTAASANNIALSQSPTAAFTINGALASGGVATLDKARKVLVTTAADESGKTITITGTDVNGNTQTEIITGPNVGTGATTLDFKTVTAMSISSASAGAITVGTNGVAASMWIRTDEWAHQGAIIQCVASGTVNYTVSGTMQDPNSPTNAIAPYLMTWTNSSDATAVGATGTIMTTYTLVPTFVKITLNSGTGSVTATLAQFAVAPY